MESEHPDSTIATFQNITGVDSHTAITYLEAANWNADLALSNFFQDCEGNSSEDPQTHPSKLIK